MPARQPLPRLWMTTDERQDERLIGDVMRLPRGAGIVFRHYSLPEAERRALFERVKRIARLKQHLLLLAGPAAAAGAWGADGSHGRGPAPRGALRSAPAHDLREIRAAERDGADFLFVSPVFPTRSHPDAPALGPALFVRLVRRTHLPVIALGGMDAERGRTACAWGAYGWAGIDAWGAKA